MSRRFLNIFLVVFSFTLLFIVSCKKNNLAIDKDITPPGIVKFNRSLPTDTVSTYYINSANTPFKLPVGSTTVSDKDRTIQFTYTSRTATSGVQFNAPATLVIPAGKALDTLVFNGLFAGYPTSTRLDTVDISITGGDVPASAYNGRHRLILRKYCDVVLPDLVGTYANTNEYSSAGAFSYGPYTTSVKNLVATSATTATGQLSNLYDDSWNDINVTFDWSNPAAFKITIPLQPTGKSYSGIPNSVRSSTASGAINTFSSCDNSVSIAIDLVNANTGATTTSNYRIVLRR